MRTCPTGRPVHRTVLAAAVLAGWALMLLLADPAAAAPANDALAGAQVLSGPAGTVTGSNVGATGEPGEPSHGGQATAIPAKSVWYSWTPPESGPAVVTTAGSGFTTLLAVYTGQTVNGLTTVTNAGPRQASTLGFPNPAGATVRFSATAGTTYRIAVDGAPYCERSSYPFGCLQSARYGGSIRLQYALNPPANDDFTRAQVLPGVDGTVVGSNRRATSEPAERDHAGRAPQASLWYAWTPSEGGQAVVTTRGSGFDTTLGVYTGDSLGYLTTIAENDAWSIASAESRVFFTATAGTTYRIAVDGVGASRGTVSLQYALNPPVNDDPSGAQPLGVAAGTVSGTNVRSTGTPGEPVHAASPPDRTVWFSWAPPESGPATITTRGSTFDTTLAVPIRLSGPSAGSASVGYTTADGTATAPTDYLAKAGTVVFEPGELAKTVTVTVVGETLAEANEDFRVVLGGVSGATIGAGTGSEGILDDDTPGVLKVGDPATVEGTGGSTILSFPVSLAAPHQKPLTVNFTTVDGTAKATSDYTASVGTLVFNPGETTKNVNVSITGDALDEEDEYLWLSLAAPVNATLADDLGKGTVADDDAAPSLSVSDVTVDEGSAGTTSYRSVYARLSAPSGRTVTVSWATANGTATAGEDYLAGQGTLTFQPGEIEKFLVVGVRGDDVMEPDETFVAALSNPSWATLADPNGLVTIRNDD